MNEKAERLVEAITIPKNLSERQVQIARSFAKSKMMDGHTVSGFCSDNGMSTKTLYVWLDDEAFKSYLSEIQGAVIPTDERSAYENIKKKIMQISEKENPSIKEIELFISTFQYVVTADNRERISALGIDTAPANSAPFKTVEQRKQELLTRLKS